MFHGHELIIAKGQVNRKKGNIPHKKEDNGIKIE